MKRDKVMTMKNAEKTGSMIMSPVRIKQNALTFESYAI